MTSETKLKLLQFLVQGVHLCMDFHYIERVLPLPLLEKVPAGPLYLAGLMNLRGQSIPVIDLALRLGLTRDLEYSLNTPILLCSDNSHQVGLIIDKIFGMIDVEEKSIQMHEEFVRNHSPFLGAVTLDAGVSLLINTSQILAFSLTGENKEFNLGDIINLAKNE